jgi:glycosyltransferase involved in cell wall biosynthesis
MIQPSSSPSPLISVITVALNAASTISRTLESVRTQNGVQGLVEHIVVDGCSSDGTLDIIRAAPHVRWISEPDNGISDAFNKGMLLAKGEYLLYLNADDHLFDATVLRDIVGFIRAKRHPNWIVGDVAEASGDTTTVWTRRFPPTCWSLCLRNRIGHPAVFLKREVQQQVGGFDTRFRSAMDYDLWYRLCREGYKPTYIRRVVSVFTLGGVSSNRSPAAMAETATVVARFRNTPMKRLVGRAYDELGAQRPSRTPLG